MESQRSRGVFYTFTPFLCNELCMLSLFELKDSRKFVAMTRINEREKEIKARYGYRMRKATSVNTHQSIFHSSSGEPVLLSVGLMNPAKGPRISEP